MARLLTTIPLREGEAVVFEELGGGWSLRGAVQATSVGGDNIRRVDLRFTDPAAAEAVKKTLRREGLLD